MHLEVRLTLRLQKESDERVNEKPARQRKRKSAIFLCSAYRERHNHKCANYALLLSVSLYVAIRNLLNIKPPTLYCII